MLRLERVTAFMRRCNRELRKDNALEQPGELLYDVRYPERLSRFLIFVKWLLVIPHAIILYFLSLAMGIVTFIAWFGILFTGRYPRGLWMFSMSVMSWAARVSAYYMLQRDEYPPFGNEPYPVRFEMVYPGRQSRLLIFVKWLLVLPHMFVLYFLFLGLAITTFIAWFAILITGSYPRSLFSFAVGVNRWTYRVLAYWYLLTDQYPPFTLGPEPMSAAPDPFAYNVSN
jgi:hypothetical protein